MRGLYTAVVLAVVSSRLSNIQNADLGHAFDLIVGTSTGGILACGLASGLPPEAIVKLYTEHGPLIFERPMPESKTLSFIHWVFRHLNSAANRSDQLREALEKLFKRETLGEVYRRRGIALCIPSVDMLKETARVFKTSHDPKKNMDGSITLVDVCMATSAAPVYLPMVAMESPNVKDSNRYFVDGGLWANNPLLIGLIEALTLTEPTQPIQIISVGTCPSPSGNLISSSELNRGLYGWLFGAKTLSVSMAAQADGTTHMAKFLAREFTKLDRKIDIVRFPQVTPSSDQIKQLKLDLATEKALTTLKSLGENDAINIVSRCHATTDGDSQIVEEIFSSLQPADRQEDFKNV